ncbi:MAG: hypothetical protein E7391_06535 [Ruminococcaceae bacterium]|nr:hypothetical protein [Oscillospiraceae bacterium]
MIYICLMAVLATMKVTLQGYFSKGRVSLVNDSLMLNSMIFISLFISMSILFLREIPPLSVIMYAIVLGLSNLAFQCFYTFAFKTGSVSLTTTINQFNFIYPMLFGIIAYSERISLFSTIGILLASVGLPLVTFKKSDKGTNGKWLLFTLLASVFSGISNIILLMFTHTQYVGMDKLLLLTSYFFGAVVSFIMAKSIKIKEKSNFYIDTKLILGVIAIGIILAMHNLTIMKGITVMQSGILHSFANALTIILITLTDFILYKQKLTKIQIIGITIILFSIIFINL